tara:strand:- start:571 stop:1110 length:540 start_codon:yes stop_codon:yes gene_type:complete
MTEWVIKPLDEDSKDESEEFEEDSEPLEEIIQSGPSQPTPGIGNQEISPFLDSEPIENLEQDLEQVPTNGDNGKEDENPEEQAMLYNAPQYGGGYDSENYEKIKSTSDTELDVSGGGLMTRDTAFHQGTQRTVDTGAWQQEHQNQMQSQQEKYQARQPKKFKQQDVLPFDVGENIRKIE